MSDYMPTTDEVLGGYVVHTTTAMNPEMAVPVASDAFYRWLAAHDREVAAKAFVEGGVFVLRDQGLPNDVYVRDALDKHNPYRIEGDA